MRIGEIARASGVGVETVRFYEQKGLIGQPPRPKNGGYRSYPAEAALRITFIRNAQHLGFSLNEIAELLFLNDQENAVNCGDFRHRAETKRREIENKIDDLHRIKMALDELIGACPGKGSAKRCSILNAIKNGSLVAAAPSPGQNKNGARQ